MAESSKANGLFDMVLVVELQEEAGLCFTTMMHVRHTRDIHLLVAITVEVASSRRRRRCSAC
jgi:hypothetical protein